MRERRKKVEPHLQLVVKSKDLVEVVLHVRATLFGSIIEDVLHRPVPEVRSRTLVQASEPVGKKCKICYAEKGAHKADAQLLKRR
jgi:hypothetical protein